jgi:putative ABC transport system permease protein
MLLPSLSWPSASEALEKLRHGRYCLVPDHFQRESGLGVGDKFAVVPPESPEHPVEYEIAGVVSMDGWHWMSKGLRRGRAAGLMFAPYGEVRRDFGIQRVTHFWMNLDGTATEDEIKASLQTIAQRKFDGQLANSRRRERGPGNESARFGGRRRGFSSNVTYEPAVQRRDLCCPFLRPAQGATP